MEISVPFVYYCILNPERSTCSTDICYNKMKAVQDASLRLFIIIFISFEMHQIYFCLCKKCEIYIYTLYILLSRFLGTNFLFFTTPNLCIKIKVR